MSTKKENELGANLPGEVRISLETYHTLLNEAIEADESKASFEGAKNAIGGFLNFCMKKDRTHFQKIIEDFNEQSSIIKIYIDDYGDVKMGIKKEP